MKLTKKLVPLVIGLCLVLPATAHDYNKDDPNEAAIKARLGFMNAVSFTAGPLFGMAKGKVEYNAETAAQLAKNLHSLSTMKNSAMWPQGSDNTKYAGKTRALPENWTTWPKSGEAHQAWTDAAAALVPVAGNGLDALKSKIGDVGQACKNCHDDFRAEDY